MDKSKAKKLDQAALMSNPFIRKMAVLRASQVSANKKQKGNG